MCRQRAGCNPGTAKADGQRPWWKLPRRVWGVLRVWRLANGRLESPNERGLCAGKGGFEAFYGFEAWQTVGSNALTREGYVQAKGKLQCWNADGQELGGSCREGCAGKGPGCNPGAAKADGQAWWKLPRTLKARAEKFHTCGGPRRHPGLGEGRGRRIYK